MLAIWAHQGNHIPNIFETLSKHSPAASSYVWPIVSNSKRDFQRYISVCPPDTVRTTEGKFISETLRSRRLANIWLSIWSIAIYSLLRESANVWAVTIPVRSEGASHGRVVQAIISISESPIQAPVRTSSIHGKIALAWLRAATSGTTPPVISCSICVRVDNAIHCWLCITATEVSSQDVSKARMYKACIFKKKVILHVRNTIYMDMQTFSYVLTLGGVGIAILIIWYGILMGGSIAFRKLSDRYVHYEYYIGIIGFLSFFSTLSVLIYEHIYHLTPCTFCWWQRVFMIPLWIIVLVSLITRVKKNHWITFILAIFGWYFSSYQYYFQFKAWVLGQAAFMPCSATGGSCIDTDGILIFGFITMPAMGLAIFIAIALLSLLAHRVSR